MSFLDKALSAYEIIGAIDDKLDYFNRRARLQSGFTYRAYANGVVADNVGDAANKQSEMLAERNSAGQYYYTPIRTSIVMVDGSKWTFDAVDNIKYTSPSKITQFPVENKASISDHVINENPKLSFEGYFSEANSKAYQGRDDHTHSTFYKALLAMRDARSVVTITTPLDVYPNMIVDTVEFNRSAQTGTGICVNLSFQKVRWVSTGTTTAWVTTQNPVTPAKEVEKQTVVNNIPPMLKNPNAPKEKGFIVTGLDTRTAEQNAQIEAAKPVTPPEATVALKKTPNLTSAQTQNLTNLSTGSPYVDQTVVKPVVRGIK
jgi:hypothetical protein